MGDEREFKIRITGDASSSVAAFQQAGQAAQQTKSKLAELTAEQKAQATDGQGAGGVQEDSKNTEELTKKTGFLNLKKTELKKLVRELRHEFPIAAQAGKMMMNPVVASLTLGIGAFSYLKQKLDEWNKALDEAGARNASRDFLPGIEAKKSAMHEAAVSAAEFETALKNIGAAEDEFKTKVAGAIDKLHEFINAQAEVNSAAEAKELAEVDLKQKTGKIDEVGAIKARAAIKERYRKMQDDLKTKGEQEELKLQESELEKDKATAPALAVAAKEAAKKRDALKAKAAKSKADLAAGEKKSNKEGTGEYDVELNKALDAQTEVENKWGAVAGDTSPQAAAARGIAQGKLAEAAKAVEEARRTRDMQARFNEKNRGLIDNTETSLLPQATEDAATAQKRAKDNADRISELGRSLPLKREVLGIRERGREMAGGLKDQTTAMDASGQIAEKLNQGREKEKQLLDTVSNAAHSGNAVKEEVVKALNAIHQQNEALAAELRARIASLEGTRKASVPSTWSRTGRWSITGWRRPWLTGVFRRMESRLSSATWRWIRSGWSCRWRT